MWRVGDGPSMDGDHVEAAVEVDRRARDLGLEPMWNTPHDGLFPCAHDGPCVWLHGRHFDGEMFSLPLTLEVV